MPVECRVRKIMWDVTVTEEVTYHFHIAAGRDIKAAAKKALKDFLDMNNSKRTAISWIKDRDILVERMKPAGSAKPSAKKTEKIPY